MTHGKEARLFLDGGNSNIFGIFTPKIGKMIQFDVHIFSDGVEINHQLYSFLHSVKVNSSDLT